VILKDEKGIASEKGITPESIVLNATIKKKEAVIIFKTCTNVYRFKRCRE